jgi:hypothetical protein
VRDRVHYLDLARQPYTPPNPGLHHRNETLAGIADPHLLLHVGRQGTWSTAGRFGISVPVGRTEANPFELGRQGLRHQHNQFGTGTWDPLLGGSLGRTIGPFDLQINALVRLTLAENRHGYRAGNRYSVMADATRRLGPVWRAEGGLLLAREEAERWDGRVESEGNLGRTDLFLSLGAARTVSSRDALSVRLQRPLVTEATGEQVEIPAVLSLAWSR